MKKLNLQRLFNLLEITVGTKNIWVNYCVFFHGPIVSFINSLWNSESGEYKTLYFSLKRNRQKRDHPDEKK